MAQKKPGPLESVISNLTIVKNNNPGAIEDGDFARSQPGYVKGNGRFAQFQTEQHGIDAQTRLLSSKNYAGKSVKGILDRYAPAGDNSRESRANYIGYVASRVGIDPDHPVPPEKVATLAQAMREFETGKKQNVKFTPYAGETGGATTMPNLPSAPKASQGELDAMKAPHPFEISNPFEEGPKIKAGLKKVDERSQTQDTMITGAIDQLNTIQDERTKKLEDTVAVKQGVTQQMQQQTQDMIDSSIPIFQKKQDILNRKQELRSMNPLARLFKGLTDSRYNEVDMAEEERTTAEQEQLFNERYDHMRKLYGDALSNQDQQFNDANKVLDLETANVSQDLQMQGMALASADRLVSNMVDGIQKQSALQIAQNQAKTEILSNLSEGQTTAALEQAKAQGGKTMINGVEFTTGQLTELSQGLTSKRLGLEGMKLGYAQNQIAFAESMEEQVIKAMTPEERKAALANGGMYQNQQLTMGKLAAAVQTDLQAGELSLVQSQIDQSGPMLEQSLKIFQNQVKGSTALVSSLLGYVPTQLSRFHQQGVVELQQLNSMLMNAPQAQRPQLQAQLLPRVQALQKRLEDEIDNIAVTWGGNNKTMQSAAKSWLRGMPLSGPESTAALVQFARYNLPSGTPMSSSSAAVFQQVKGIVADWDKRHQNEAKDEKGLMALIGQKMAGARNDAQLLNALQLAPAFAKKITDSTGKMHPFSRIPADDFMIAIREGDKMGLEAVAGANSITPEQAAANPKLAGVILAAQTSATMQWLDANHQTEDFRPSAAFADLVSNPKFQKMIVDNSNAMRGNSFGDFIVDSAAGPGFGQAFGTYVRTVQGAAQTNRAEQQRNNMLQAHALKTDPFKRAQFILGSIEGLTPAEENLMINYLRQASEGVGMAQAVGAPVDAMGGGGNAQQQNIATSKNSFIDSVMTGGKLTDPHLEEIRRKAAAEWLKMSGAADRGFDRIYGGK